MAHAARAWILDDGAVTLAALAGSGGHHLAEHSAHDLLHEALSMAVRASDRLGAALCAGATALLTQGERIDLDVRRAAEYGGFQVDGSGSQRIASRLCARHRAL